MNSQKLHWELHILCRSIAYNNLSGAAQHVGLSQPQLSRIVARLEAELQVVLLDREARRKSAWTPTAFRLAETYSQSARKLESEINKVTGSQEPHHLRVGTLEGLIPLALQFLHALQSKSSIQILELDVQDLNRLEERFFEGELDLLLSSRAPGRRKPKYVRQVGYQSLERVKSKSQTAVLSSFEFATQSGAAAVDGRVFVCNSLEARRAWVKRYGGQAIIPSPVHASRSASGKGDEEVLLLAAERIGPSLWAKLMAMEPALS